MENASKALIMAAGVLIGLLILSLAVYLIVSFGTTSRTLHKQNEEQQIAQFNSQFTAYEGKEGITIHDIVSIANLATETNKHYEFAKRTSTSNPQMKKDNYIAVKYVNSISVYSRFHNKLIENAYNTPASQLTNYNQLLNLDSTNLQEKRDENNQRYFTLPEYECTVEVSEITRKSMASNFYKKINLKSI